MSNMGTLKIAKILSVEICKICNQKIRGGKGYYILKENMPPIALHYEICFEKYRKRALEPSLGERNV